MRVRGAGRGWRTLSRLALIGVIGGGAAACSTDASRLTDPFTNPFASNEPAATGSLGEDGEMAPTRAPAIRTPRIQSQELAAPGPAMTPRPVSRVAASEPVSGTAGGAVAGMNPDAGRGMTPRVAPAAPQPKLVFGKGPNGSGPNGADKAAETRKAAEKLADRKALEAKKAAEKAADARREAEETRKEAEAKALADRKHAAKKTAEAKSGKPGTKEASKEVSKAEQARLAKAEATQEAKLAAAKKVAEAKAAEAAAKAASAKESAKEAKQAAKEPAKEPVKAAEKPGPVKVASADPVAPVAAESNESFRWPAKGRVINGYGTSGNEGINIAVPEGTPVKAAEDGTVAYAGSDVKGYGKLVLVRHSNGFVSAYAHNGEIDVRPGDKVKRGQTIAKSGATGNVTSPQLHFEIRKGATPVDPIPHLASN